MVHHLDIQARILINFFLLLIRHLTNVFLAWFDPIHQKDCTEADQSWHCQHVICYAAVMDRNPSGPKRADFLREAIKKRVYWMRIGCGYPHFLRIDADRCGHMRIKCGSNADTCGQKIPLMERYPLCTNSRATYYLSINFEKN
jgi:hypothetical protein